MRELRALVDRLQALPDMRQQELNRVEALEQSTTADIIAMVKEHVAWLDEQTRKLQGSIANHIGGHPKLRQDAQLMQSIPVIGNSANVQFLAYIGDVRRFKGAKALTTLST